MTEEWKDIEGYENIYQVSNMGRIRSVDRYENCNGTKRIRKGRILINTLSQYGYKVVCLYKNAKQKQFFVHRLVAMAFIPNPNNYPIINHKDEDKANNYVDNLEWCTIKYNSSYGTAPKRISEKQLNRPDKSKPVLQYTKDGHLVGEYPSQKEASRKTKIKQGLVSACCIGKIKTAGGYIWKFK